MNVVHAFRLLVLAACLLPVAVRARGETWLLTNGDRLTGRLLAQDANTLQIQHAQLGRLTIPRSALQTGSVLPAGDRDATPVPAAGRVPATGTLAQSERLQWKRQVDMGYAQQSGAKEKQDLSLRLQVDGKSGPNTFRGTARLLQAEVDDQTVTDRREADFRWRHDVNRRLFAQMLTTYTVDTVRRINLSLEQQIGGGYRIIDGSRHKANVGLGAVVQYLDRPEATSQTALLGSVFQDYAYELNQRVKLTQESSFIYTDAGTWNARSGTLSVPQQGNFRVKFNTGVQSKVTDHMSVNVRFEYDYDRSVFERELRADQRLTTSLGYLW